MNKQEKQTKTHRQRQQCGNYWREGRDERGGKGQRGANVIMKKIWLWMVGTQCKIEVTSHRITHLKPI